MKDYDETQPSNFLMYFDANSLYPTAMLQPLPLKDFKWMGRDELTNWKEILETEGKGCVLEVDLEYPQNLHDDHDDYPLAPESLEIGGVRKLTPNLQNKNKMVLHAKSLQQYLTLGMKLKKIHARVAFKEEPYMKPFIELNTKMRTAAKNVFEKDFFKLMSNAVYGKTLENVPNRQNVYITSDENKTRKLTSQPHFKHFISMKILQLFIWEKQKSDCVNPFIAGLQFWIFPSFICFNFIMVLQNQSGKESKFFTQILIPLFMIFQQKMFLQT